MRTFAVLILLLCTQSAWGQSRKPLARPDALSESKKKSEYDAFAQAVDRIIRDGSAVAVSERERADIHALQFQLANLNKDIEAGNWKHAAELRNQMKVALGRSAALAADAPRRQAQQVEKWHREELSQRDRQHKEDVRQRERIHQEDMRQRSLLNQQLLNRLRTGY